MRKKLIVTTVISLVLIIIFIYQYINIDNITLKQVSYSKIPDWNTLNNDNLKSSLQALQKSCRVFLNSDKDKSIGNKHINLKVKDLLPVCEKVKNLSHDSNLKQFFEENFTPYIYYKHRPIQGTFTGYYMPELNGSLVKTKQYPIPLYALPKDLIQVDLKSFKRDTNITKIYGRVKNKMLVPYYSRRDINNGALKDTPVIAWIGNEIDRQLLEIEGSGVIKLPDSKKLYVGYSGENGKKYKSIATILIEHGVLTKDNASNENIHKYFQEHPQQHDLLNKNESFVFFKKLEKQFALGAQGVELTPGYSMAVDSRWIPYGLPLFLTTHYVDFTDTKSPKPKKLNRLMVSQDTGGAITGAVRGDVFWGEGETSVAIASHMHEKGYYWVLLPKNYSQQ